MPRLESSLNRLAVFSAGTMAHARAALKQVAAGFEWGDWMNWAITESTVEDSRLGSDAVLDLNRPFLLKNKAQWLAIVSRLPAVTELNGGPAAHRTLAQSILDTLMEFSSDLDTEAQLAIEVVLRRALTPRAALLTWPLDRLFTPEELLHLNLGAEWHPVAEHAPRMNRLYEGYLCLILKFTRLCNLRCSYCHDWRAGRDQTMPLAVIVRAFKEALRNPSIRTVDFIWHGGEPTLLGAKGFLRLLALQEMIRRPGQVVRNLVQTNASTVTGTWSTLFSRYGFRVSVSIDGPRATHDLTRRDAGGRATFDKVAKGIDLLLNAGALSGVLVVVSEPVLSLGAGELVKFFQAHGIRHVGLLPVRPRAGVAGIAESDTSNLSHSRYVQFLLGIHAERLASPTPWINVREIDNPLAALNNGIVTHCELLGGCVGTFFSIEPNGDVWHCDKYQGDPEYRLGNVLRDDLDAIQASERVRRLRELVANDSLQRHCPFFRYCNGWCPHESYVAKYRSESRSDCCGLDSLFDGLLKMGSAQN